MVSMVPDSRNAGPSLEEAARRAVLEAGFERVGFGRAGWARGAGDLREWLERGHAGSMDWIARTLAKREDPRLVLEGARTVIVAALHHAPPSPPIEGEPIGRVAAYARGRDYHLIIERRLRGACEALRKIRPAAVRYYVDTGPVLERDWAREAGIGWIGKNACVIDASAGSWFFLGVILTTLGLEPDLPAVDACGSCTLCLEACPTGALIGPGELDARRCISYLTIEHPGPISAELEERMGNLVFGCDICQEVCPYNRPGVPEGDADLAPRPENIAPRLGELASLDAESFRARFPGSAVRRAKLRRLLRNVLVALGNSRSPDAVGILGAAGGREDVARDPVLAATAERALRRLAARARDAAPAPTLAP